MGGAHPGGEDLVAERQVSVTLEAKNVNVDVSGAMDVSWVRQIVWQGEAVCVGRCHGHGWEKPLLQAQDEGCGRRADPPVQELCSS